MFHFSFGIIQLNNDTLSYKIKNTTTLYVQNINDSV